MPARQAEVEFPIPMLPETYGLQRRGLGRRGRSSAGRVLPARSMRRSIDQPLKSSVGASIIWDSPFGPLRGDFAYVLTKATDDKTQVFALTLQTLL